ncbi:MAG: L,D-transpeptidase, partial [Clostridia bacterium]|nr:L,D-transpeptidase [Clostridia bacterium]
MRKGLALLAALSLLVSAPCLAEDFSVTEIVEEIDLPEPGETLLATDVEYFTPNEINGHSCGHADCFWNLKMGCMDEEAVWRVLTQPVTVLKGAQREQIRVRKEPSAACEQYTGVITCASQCVHVLERGEEWSLVEAYSSCEEGSTVRVWALPFQGYVKTSLLEEKQVDQTYGLVIDKLQQRLYVFREGKLFTTLLCSTGFPRADTPFAETPAGEFLMVS